MMMNLDLFRGHRLLPNDVAVEVIKLCACGEEQPSRPLMAVRYRFYSLNVARA